MNKINNNNLKTIEKYKKHRYSLAKTKNTVDTDINSIRKLGKQIKNNLQRTMPTRCDGTKMPTRCDGT